MYYLRNDIRVNKHLLEGKDRLALERKPFSRLTLVVAFWFRCQPSPTQSNQFAMRGNSPLADTAPV